MSPPNCSVHSAGVDAAVASLLLLEAGLGLLGNAVALWTFFFRLKVWKPPAVYLLNLALSDLLLAACLPIQAALLLRRGAGGLGPGSCRTQLFLRALGRGVGVAFLAAVALDRYLRVVHPRLRVNLLPLRAARAISVGVWLLVAALVCPGVLAPGARCPPPAPGGASGLGALWWEALLLLQFLAPFGLVLCCSAGVMRALRARPCASPRQPRLRRARALLAAVVALFVLCFLPAFLARALAAALRAWAGCALWRALVLAAELANSLTYLQSVLNPVVYCFSHPAFRSSYRRVLHSLRGHTPAPAPPDGPRDSYS